MIRTTTELRKLLRNSTPILGSERVLKLVKQGKIKHVLLASNCKEEVKRKEVKISFSQKYVITVHPEIAFQFFCIHLPDTSRTFHPLH